MDSIECGGLCKSKTENGDYIYSLRYDEFQGIYHAKIKTLEERIKKIEKYICEKSL